MGNNMKSPRVMECKGVAILYTFIFSGLQVSKNRSYFFW